MFNTQKIRNLTADVDNLTGKISAALECNDKLNGRVQNLESNKSIKLSSIEGELAAINRNLSTLAGCVNLLTDRLTRLEARVNKKKMPATDAE